MGGIGIPTLSVIALALIPYLDRERDGTGVWFGGPGGVSLFWGSVAVGLAAVIGIEAFAIQFGWLREWWPDVPQLLITSINPGTVLVLIYFLYSVWVVRRYNSTRAGAIAVFTCFLCGFIVLTIIGTYLRGPNWEFFWSQADWPVH
jgi:FtsH-binding integral membrane protein